MTKSIFDKNDIANPLGITHNFDVSVILPFYKKIDEFKKVLPLNAAFFQRNGIEVVISMDDDSQEDELILLIRQYPFINWKVIINRQKHEWRNPCKAINVGIKNSNKKYILVCSPESEFFTDAIFLMRRMLEYYENHFAIGTVAFAYGYEVREEDLSFHMPYGSIMAKKEDFIAIKGYDEALNKWGGDDDNLRARLEFNGVKKLLLPEVKLIHREDDPGGEVKRFNKRNLIPAEIEMNIFFPLKACANDIWGEDYSEIILDWRINVHAYEYVCDYARNFEKSFVAEKDLFLRKYYKVLLTQSYNEGDNIADFLDNMGKYFDGIILLDDGSTDNTFELAQHPKLLIKVKKKRIGFIDIENRNITLDLASFVNSEWFCFMDTDERFCDKFSDFDSTLKVDQADIISFFFVHIWDKKGDIYNGEYPYSNNGIVERVKMFRNFGHCQINTLKERMHFVVIPHQKNISKSKILYKHFGMDSTDKRDAKFKLYQKEDIAGDQKDYGHIIKHNSKLLKFKDIQIVNSRFINTEL